MTDFAGGMNFTLLVLLTYFLGQYYTTRQTLVLIIVVLSRTELALFLLARVLKRGRDARFDEMREKFWVSDIRKIVEFGRSACQVLSA